MASNKLKAAIAGAANIGMSPEDLLAAADEHKLSKRQRKKLLDEGYKKYLGEEIKYWKAACIRTVLNHLDQVVTDGSLAVVDDATRQVLKEKMRKVVSDAEELGITYRDLEYPPVSMIKKSSF